MRLMAFIKIGIKGMIRGILPLVLTYTIFPIALSFIIGYFQTELFTPSVKMPKIEISIVDNDKTKLSGELINFLNSEDMKEIIEIKNNNQGKYEIQIPKGYEGDLLKLRDNSETRVNINVSKEGASRLGEILGSVIDSYNYKIVDQTLIEESIDKRDISKEDKQEIIYNLNKDINEIYSNKSIKDNLLDLQKSLSSYEYYSIKLLSFSFITLMMALALSEYMSIENGTYKRIMSTSITKVEYFNCNLVSNYIMAIVVNLIYVFSYRLMDMSFKGSLPLLLSIVIFQSLLITTIAGFMSVIFKKKQTNMILMGLIIYQSLMGGFIPIDKISNSEILKTLFNYSPDVIITKTYKNFLIFNDFNSIKINLIITALLSVVFYALSIIRVKKKEVTYSCE
ncbi:ABC transporter permease protein [Gottschalkia acidurici 9a]|uniref:ABC transporter permease protein n=1 Tax=Gottschalkia acidurici (strain ATCC 7906 / DSM 604 / BCRC 14475 / CIP 104303 / KCTC 5404 / NCIMB 10678 / 9a) TaxID=1128398 RepID=K0B0R2_GOTA9|nr:ABC transporter permease [Gottschalkia acidurici]AFS79613.1 ABC transporter permease protein [Gottschalkia acidurici 9a]